MRDSIPSIRVNASAVCCYTRLLRLLQIPLPVALFAALALGAWAGSTSRQTSAAKSSAKKKKSVAKTSRKTAAPARSVSTSTKRPATGKPSLRSLSKRPPVSAHRAPQQPSPDRLKEIQTALAAKGYFTAEPNGAWGPSSIDALKRFQHDQNLVEDGKIGSLSLIALGLGPKREPADSPQKTAPVDQKTPDL